MLLDTGVLYNPDYFKCDMNGIAPTAFVDALNQLGACADNGTITWKEISSVVPQFKIWGTDNTFRPYSNDETPMKYCVTNSENLKKIGLEPMWNASIGLQAPRT
ncbi:hypothetical protein Igni_0809 [Ignicoccus hospitalis KIN4/I]|uniref:Uncharacterized protein n=1 Tax=Ignicoccus hospitalis (strain KIN4/I / DSM 18386 / JCM 14125) TaxID=453591 RepID=A8AAN9_IGNH4|nr:hypothetical protein Igni_0809 [Ignicoccus hospitalis KIN4/I]